MDVKKNFYRGLGNPEPAVLFSVLLFASCQDDLQTSVHTGPGIRFSVSEDKDGMPRGQRVARQKQRHRGIPFWACYPCRPRTAARGCTCTP